MIGKLAAKVFGTSNEREVKRIRPLVDQINALEPQMKQLTDEQLRAKTDEFRGRIRERLQGIEEETERVEARKEILDQILPGAFAVAREAGLGFSSDDHLRAEEICRELPGRAAMIQSFISFTTAMLALRHGSIRGLARAMTGDDEIGLEPTVRRWLGARLNLRGVKMDRAVPPRR